MKNLLLLLSFLGTTSLFAQEDNVMINFAKTLPDYTYELNKTYVFHSDDDVLKIYLDKKGKAKVERSKNNEVKSSRIYFLGNTDSNTSSSLYEIMPDFDISAKYWFIPFEGGDNGIALSSSKAPIILKKSCDGEADIQMFYFNNIFIYSDYIIDRNEGLCKEFFAEREGVKFDGLGVFFPAKAVEFID